jgi:hypothetical protein
MPPRGAWTFGAAHAVTALLLGWSVFRCLPARWMPVDATASVLVMLDLAAAAGLLWHAPWGPSAARAASIASLAVGLVALGLLGAAASWLSGVYGPVGAGGAAIMVLAAALALPYLVVRPCVELVYLGPRRTP